MSEELLVNISPVETRVALVENGALQEVYVERSHNKGLVGNIYLGRVVRILPGMQAAFVDIGLARTGFIHAKDMASLRETDRAQLPILAETPEAGDIRGLVREGQALLVQVSKDPIGSKGPRLTTQLSFSSRYLVYMPKTAHIGVSARIDDNVERSRLRRIMEGLLAQQSEPCGFIVRTVAEGVSEEELRLDVHFLQQLWANFQERVQQAQAPAAVHTDMPLALRALRDLVRAPIERIRVDSQQSWEQMREFCNTYYPSVSPLIELYKGERPLLDLYGVEDEIVRGLEARVPLKSNGHLIIEQTEAMTTVDVNTGAFVGRRNLEETIFKTNMEAAAAIVRQLRLRNLGGIIVLDFIDMQEPEHERQVQRTLEKALKKDHAKTSITGVSDLGLVEMTRKRTRESLGQMLCSPCPVCQGRGQLKSAETVCYEIFREILREARAYDNQKFLVLASELVVERLLDEEAIYVADLEAFVDRPIEFQVEELFHQEQYDIVLV